MLSNSIQNIVEDYEFLHKRKAYYQLVRDAANAELKANKDTPHRAWKAQEAYDKATASLEYIKFAEENINRHTKTNGKYIQSLCSLTFDDDRHSEYNLERVVEKFTSMLSSTRKEPLWKTLSADGIQPTDEDKEWFDLLFKREVNPKYTLNYKVSQLDNLHTDAQRIASSCTIRIEELSTRVRFTYADSPEEPMANTYIFYWMYGEGDVKDKLATSENELKFFNETNSMLPLGIGLTDENGYLVQSAQMGDLMKKFQEIDLENATFEVKPGTVYGGWSEQAIIEANGFKEMGLRTFQPSDRTKFKNYADAPWNQWLNTKYFEKILTNYNQIEKLGPSNGVLPEITAPSRIIHSYVRHGYFIENDEKALESLSIHEKKQFDHVSNQYFFPDREYGFFAYPVNRGNFKTKNLLSLTEGDAPVAWRGMVPIASSENEQPKPIQLHCTLPDWDRRITQKLDILNFELQKVTEKVKMHAQNIERLTGMSRLVSLQQKYPYAVRGDDQIKIGETLLGKIDSLAEAINSELAGDKEESEFVTTKDMEGIDQAANALKDIMFNEAFLTEFNTYLKTIVDTHGALVDENGKHHAGPYMETEPFWGHIIETLMQCITALDKTQLSDKVWVDWVEPLLEDFSNQEENFSLLRDLNDDLESFSEFSGYGKLIHGLENRDDVSEPLPVKEYREKLQFQLSRVDLTMQSHELDRLEKEPLALEHRNPLLWVMKCYKGVATPFIHRAPGAPSILQQVIDLYSDKISEKMMKKGTLFHIKLNVALFRLCGVHELNGQALPKSLLNKLAITGYIAQSSQDNKSQFIKRLRVIKGVENKKVDLQIRNAIESIAARAMSRDKLSETIYEANKQRWYKSLMFGTTAALNVFTLMTLNDKLAGKSRYEQTLIIMQVTGELLYTSVLANKLIASWGGFNVGHALANSGNTGNAVARLFGGEAAARFLAVISMLMSVESAREQFSKGNTASGAIHMAIAINSFHVQIAYAAQQGIGRGVMMSLSQGAVSRTIATRIMATGLASLVLPFFGEVALLVSSIIAGCFVVYDVVTGIQKTSRTSLFHMFQFYQNGILESEVPLLNKRCHKLYSTQLKADANNFLDEIKDVGAQNWWEWMDDGYEWDHLCWRAVIPLYIQGFSINMIKALVKLPSGTTESTRIYGRDQSRDVRTTVEKVEDIIQYFEHMQYPDDPEDTMPSGRKKHEIAESLTKGDFIPAAGMSEDLVVIEYGKEKFISFDHLYFRQQQTVNGLNWKSLNEQSHQQYKSNYHV